MSALDIGIHFIREIRAEFNESERNHYWVNLEILCDDRQKSHLEFTMYFENRMKAKQFADLINKTWPRLQAVG